MRVRVRARAARTWVGVGLGFGLGFGLGLGVGLGLGLVPFAPGAGMRTLKRGGLVRHRGAPQPDAAAAHVPS